MRTPENDDQRALRKWIEAGLAIPEVTQLHGDAGYLLNNMIAKYTLAASRYAISVAALGVFDELEVDLAETYARRRFYGKQGGRNPFIYEHTVPAGVLRTAMLQAAPGPDVAARVLRSAGGVAVLLRGEDERLRAAGLGSRMPDGWALGDDPLARYIVAGIELSDVFLRVQGAICR